VAVEADQVIALLRVLTDRRLRAWVGGGWAVDAIVGRQSRPHRDLDLAIDADQLDLVLAVLADLGFALTIDWLPVRAELTAAEAARSTFTRWSSPPTAAELKPASTVSPSSTAPMGSVKGALRESGFPVCRSPSSFGSGRATICATLIAMTSLSCGSITGSRKG